METPTKEIPSQAIDNIISELEQLQAQKGTLNIMLVGEYASIVSPALEEAKIAHVTGQGSEKKYREQGFYVVRVEEQDIPTYLKACTRHY